MQRINAKDDAVGGGDDGERPPSSQPIAPARGLSPPQPARRIISQFDPSWSRTIPETFTAFAKAAAVLEATPTPTAKRMPHLLREIAAKRHNLGSVVREMRCDTALTDSAAFRTALEAVDRSAADGEMPFWGLTRCCPLAARATLHRSEDYAPKARADMIAVCGYDAENAGVALRPNERGYANFALQAACVGGIPVGWLRRDILSAAVVPARRTIRAEGGTFVGKTGGARVKAILDGLAAELNAPRFGNAGKLLAEIGIEVEWDFIQSRILGDAEIAALKAKLLGGEIPFDGTLQNKLCVALGVEGYNAFVREYNGNEGK